MRIDLHMHLSAEDRREAWQLYLTAMREPHENAVQSHIVEWEQFVDICDDLAIEKHVVRDDGGRMVGFGVLTNQLTHWKLLSAAHLQRRWPELERWGRIWVVGFVVTLPGARFLGAFGMILKQMTDGRWYEGQKFVMDFCGYNLDQRHIIKGVMRTLESVGLEPHAELLDRQEYWWIGAAG